MFKPYKFVKEESSSDRNENRGANGSREIVIRLPKPKMPSVNYRLWFSVTLVGGGCFLFTSQILWPWLTTPPAQKTLLKPTVSDILGVDKIPLEHNFVNVEFEFSELARKPESVVVEPKSGTVPEIPNIFYITIPKLEIEKAEVETNSQDLSPDERLGHYPGSALPGEVGNAFIYGHSVLPMFYDPKNYRTIFSTLDKLEAGDKIAIEFGKRSFLYVVEKAVVRKPEDVKPLEPISPPSLGESYLTLMTCVPMGLNTNRLLVQSKLVGM